MTQFYKNKAFGGLQTICSGVRSGISVMITGTMSLSYVAS